MRQHVLYAYVEGSEFAAQADELAAHFSWFVSDRRWLSGAAWAVNQKRPEGAWELGINLELPNPREEPDGWFADVEAIAVFTRELAVEFGLAFAIGILDSKRGITEDLFFVDSGPVDIEKLQATIGVAPP